jgi:hypothetical protein
MKNGRTIRSFADLRAAIAEVAATSRPVANPPMSMDQIRRSAEALAMHRRREAARVVKFVPRNDAGVHHINSK